MVKGPLYKDDKLEINYLPNCIEDHFLSIGNKRGYAIPRGILKELARTPRGGIERKINNFNESILSVLGQEGISVDGLHVAICQAYIEEEERYKSVDLSTLEKHK
ncbi:MAG: hypothetical protein PHF86_13640 [Candidatus Nanoarchaeia archaeon]|nr:hypothetical protein [Candidatus Nanoarchaeia archaeon]